MTDIFLKKQAKRCYVKGSTKGLSLQELLVRKFLFSKGFRFRKNVKSLPGSPDIVLPKYKTVIFINGCFWHGHTCRAGRLPSSNSEFWSDKIEANKKRDRKKNYQLKRLGWKTITIWQCDLNHSEKIGKSLNNLIRQIRGSNYRKTASSTTKDL